MCEILILKKMSSSTETAPVEVEDSMVSEDITGEKKGE